MKNLVTKPKKLFLFFFFFPPTLCPLCIPNTGFWNSWLMLLVSLLCCLLFSEGCCWKEDYIIMQIRLYNPEQTVGEGRGGTHGRQTDGKPHWAGLGWLWGDLLWNHKLGGYWPPIKRESCSQTSDFFWICLEFIVFILGSANGVYLQCLSRTLWQTNTQENCKSLTCTLFRAWGTMLQITTVRKAGLHQTNYLMTLT